MRQIDSTHDPALKSWVASANSAATDFPLQNLPFGIFRRSGSREPFRGGVAIGDQILDLAAVSALRVVPDSVAQALASCTGPTLNPFMALGPDASSMVRHCLSRLL